MSKKIMVSIGIDVDAVAGWLGSYGGQDSPSDISRGMFAGEFGVPRLLRLVNDRRIPVTWFWPGHSIETFPDKFEATVAAGHEVGMHGYSHENPLSMTPEQEAEVADYCLELFESRIGERPLGYVAPWWEFSQSTHEILRKRGFLYDHSLMHSDHMPYYVRAGDEWTPINYEADSAEEWMKPLVRGTETDLIEIPASWYLDDQPPMMFVKGSSNSHGYVTPRAIESLWRDQFDWVYREMDYAVFPMTIHPDVSGRPQNLLMLGRFIEHMSKHDGVEFMSMKDVAVDFRQQFPRAQA